MVSTANEFFTNNNSKPNKNPINGFKYTMEQDSLSQDLHFKMSKKIAQLTKVIYALNTKNDDHEAAIGNLRHEHEKEISQLIDETSGRVALLEGQLKAQSIDGQRLIQLQQNILSYEMLLEDANKKFKVYQDENIQINKDKDAKYIEQIQCLNEQIKSLKLSYEQILEDYYRLDKNIHSEKMAQHRNLKETYENEIERIQEESRNREEQLRGLISGNENEIQMKLSKAQEEIQAQMHSKNAIVKDYEKQIQDLHGSLDLLSLESAEFRKGLESEIKEEKSKLATIEAQMDQKEQYLIRLRSELLEKTDFIENLNKKIKAMESESVEKGLVLSKKSDEIVQQRKAIEKIESAMKAKIEELTKVKANNEEINQEMNFKTKQIKELKSIVENLQKKLTVKDGELKAALTEINIMNEESKEMANCTKSVSTDYEIQIQSLQRGLEELTRERVADKAIMDKIKLNHEIELAESILKIKNDYESDLEKITKKRDKDYSVREKSHIEEMQKQKEESQIRLDEERSKASKIIEKLKIELDQIKAELNTKIKAKEKQMNNVEDSLLSKDKEIKTANLQLKEIKESLSALKKENKKLSQTISGKESEIEALANDISKLKLSLEEQKSVNDKLRKSIQIQGDMNEKCNKLSAELDSKWADTLRKETGRIRNDLMDSFAIEKRKAIEKIEKDKNAEIETIKMKGEMENTNLLNDLYKREGELKKLEEEIQHLKASSESQTLSKMEEMQSLMSETERIRKQEMSDLVNSHSITVENLRKQFDRDKHYIKSEMQGVIDTNNKQFNEKYNSAIASITAEHEKKMKMKLDEVENKHRRQINYHVEELRSEISGKNKVITDEHKEEINNLCKKIASLEEQAKSLENGRRIEMERFADEKSKLDATYRKLEKSFHENMKENEYLKKQIEDFGNDYSRNQKDFSDKLKKQELELRRTYEQASTTMRTKYEDESKQALLDFNKAQNLYKDKIRELNNKQIEFEDQFINRPSRDEDLEIIQTLKAQLKVAEKEIEKLNEDKRFFQLELVNRETNFNKIFNGSPNVGVLNPTQGTTKAKSVSGEKPKTFQKLTPLPGTPFHDDPINPSKPLPPSSRRSIDNS